MRLFRRRAPIATLAVWALLVQTLALVGLANPVTHPEAQAAGPEITVTKEAPARVLAGENARYKITVQNTGDENQYNVGISDLLPFGADFAGNVSPAAAGNPTEGTDPSTGNTVLVWSNLVDLLPGASYTLEFDATLGEDGNLVGAILLNVANGASSTDERQVPKFDPSGDPITGTFTQSGTGTATTEITAITVTKSNDNAPEGELLRGVHDQRSTYTLTVRNSLVAATDSVVVSDYLPAGLEFLNCGDVDNSAAPEYPGAPDLGVPPLVPTPCPTPVSVETVTNPPPDNGVTIPPGLYTKVTWNLGTLAAAATTEIKYVAGIPLRENTATWPNGEPTPDSLAQGSNLDNNTGDSTREGFSEASLTNYVVASGQYTGQTVSGDPTTIADTSHTVAIEDVRMRKSVSPESFAGGGIATFTMIVDTSEYVTGSAIALTDLLPDGYCPLNPGQNYDPGSASDCGTGGSAPSVPFQSVTPDNATGGYTIVFDDLPDMTSNDSVTVTFTARMRSEYNSFGPRAGSKTVAGDSFTNNVRLVGTTTPIPDTGESGDETVRDQSQVTQSSVGSSINKQMKPRYFPVSCDPNDGTPYQNPEDIDPADRAFRKGDIICFKVRIDFPATMWTKGANVTDFLPVDTVIESGTWALTSNNDVDVTEAITPEIVTATLESPGSPGFVAPGSVFEAVLGVRVLAPAAPPKPDLLGNLFKFKYENTAGDLIGDRDDAPFTLVPAANVSLTKGVYEVNAPASGPNGPDVDGSLVEENSVATFRVDINNLGRPDYPGADFSIRGIETWDVLPPGFTCADISNFQFSRDTTPNATPSLAALASDIWECLDAPTGLNVNPAYGTNSQSVIVWQTPDPDSAYSLSVGQTLTFTYDMALPSSIGVSTRFDNWAGVAEFRSFTNQLNVTAPYYPADNINADHGEDEWDAQEADDPSWVVTRDAAVAKAVTTAIGEDNNNIPSQATIGEEVTYTVEVTVPAHTTVFNGLLTDPMPTGVDFLGASAMYSGGPLPGGFTFDGRTSGTLTFPATYRNSTSVDQVFQVVITARVGTLAGNTQGTNRTNTATFNSNATLGGTALPAKTAQSRVTVVEPNPRVAKSANPTDVIGGQEVEYRVEASNANGRPPSHNTVTIDCLPAEITNPVLVTVPTGTSATIGNGDGTNGCPVGVNNRIEWTVGTVLAGTANKKTLVYKATVDPDAVAGAQYTNNVALTGATLDTVSPVPYERTYTRNGSSTVEVIGEEITKGVFPEEATIGETVEYVVVTEIPANVALYRNTVLDQLPTGLSFVSTDDVFCEPVGPGCTAVEANVGFGSELTPSGQTVGWYIGDAFPAAEPRFVHVVYSALVEDVVGNVAGNVKQNSAVAWWSFHPWAATPTSVTEPPNLPGALSVGPAVADLTIIEPQLSIDKSVDNSLPAPGDTFNYTITVTNSDTSTSSEAFEIDVTDDVPAGVVVDPLSISDGGSLAGTDGDGSNGSISWADLGPLAPGESITLTYTAGLAPSSTLLSNTALTNTATVTEYYSLPTGFPERRQYGPVADPASVTPVFPFVETDKSVTAGDVAVIGDPFSWTVEVTNSGGTEAFNVSTTDTLPVNFCYDVGSATITLPGGSPTPVEPDPLPDCEVDVQQVLTWSSFGDLDVSETATITFTTTPNAAVIQNPGVGIAVPVPHTNTAQSIGEDATGATENLTGPYSGGPDTADAFIAAADLELTKTAGTSPIPAGTNATYTIDVVNNGPDPSVQPFRVVDALPPNTTFVSATGTGWTCVPSGATVVCDTATPASLASGQSLAPITVVVTTPSDAADGTAFTNTATVFPTTLDPVPSNNTDSDQVVVERSADVQIVKSTVTDPVVPGEAVSFSLAVSNNGPSLSVTPITVTDTLNSALTNATADGGADWDCSVVGQLVTCVYLQDLAAGADAPLITVTADLDEAFLGGQCLPPSQESDCLVNTAVVATTTPDPDPENNTSSVDPPVVPSADVQIVKSTVTDPVVPGEAVSFSLEVSNNGPSASVTPITVTDTLNSALTNATADGGADWDCSVVGQLVTCVYQQDLAVGADAPLITVTADLDEAFLGEQCSPPSAQTDCLVNTAVVATTTPDPDPDNNTSTVDPPVEPSADVQIVKSTVDDSGAPVSQVTPGEPVYFDLVVTNNGPSTSVAPITVTDTLNSSLSNATADGGSDWSCSVNGQDVECEYQLDLASGQSAPAIRVTADLDPAFLGEQCSSPSVELDCLVNTADVTTTTPDPDPDNNTSTVDPPVVPSADVQIVKSTVTDPVVPGESVSFSLEVSNNGPSVSVTPITVTDTLNSALSGGTASGTDWSCTVTGQDVSCVYQEDLAVGETAPLITVTADLDEAFLGGQCLPPSQESDCLVNTAVVATTTPDPDPENNTSSVDPPVVPSADVEIVKSTVTDPVTPGEAVSFSLEVSNNGPSASVTPITVTDTLNAALSNAVASGTDWSCTVTGQDVSCVYGQDLAVGETAPLITVTADLDEAFLGEQCSPPSAQTDCLVNTAVVATTTPDPDPDNNTSTVDPPVEPSADLMMEKETITSPLVSGGEVVYELVVTNNGPSTSVAPITVTDDLDAVTTFVSATGTDWTCTGADQSVACEYGLDLAAGESAPTITVTAKIDDGYAGDITNTAEVTGTTPDPDPDNNTDTVTDPVPPDLRLVATKSGVLSSGNNRISWDITVRNLGPTFNIEPITLTDQLQTGLTFVSASGPGWDCGVQGQLVTCLYPGTLLPGQTASLTIVTDVSVTGTQISNSVTVGTDGGTCEEELGAEACAQDVVQIPAGDGGKVPDTGAQVGPMLAAALAVLLVGGLALQLRRRFE